MSNSSFKYNEPSWKSTLGSIAASFGMTRTEEEMEREYTYGENEVGLKNPISGAGIVIRNDGCIYIMSSPTTGIIIDPSTQSVTIVGETVSSVSKVLNLRTKPDGLRWNGYPLNPELYSKTELDPRLKTRNFQLQGREEYYNKKEKKWEWRETYVSPVGKRVNTNEFSDDVINIMKDLGLPV